VIGYQCVGGPFDGTLINGPINTALVFMSPIGRPTTTPSPLAPPYWVRQDKLLFVGHGFRICSSCSAWLSPDTDGKAIDPCPLCGSEA
jgi:hypothetical protein